MAAYDVIDTSRQGLEEGLLGTKEGGWICQESGGIEFGMPVFGYVNDREGLYNYYNDTAKVAFDADFVASNTINGTVNGVAIAEVTFTSTHVNTMNLLIAAYEALTGVRAELDTTDGTSRTLLIQVKGGANVTTSVVTNGASQAVATITYASSQVYVGISLFNQKYPGEYEQYDAVNVMTRGKVWCPVLATVKSNDEAYIDIAGAELGYFSSAGVEVNARFRSDATTGNLALLETNGQTEMTYSDIF
jgi:hypothetical protein